MKKILGLLLSFIMVFALAACNTTGDETPQLATPENLTMNAGVIVWDEVENATSYTVTIYANVTNGLPESHDTDKTSYTVSSSTLLHAFDYSVVAKAEGYKDSEPATGSYSPAAVPPTNAITVTISGYSIMGSGQSITLRAAVSNATDTTVTWSIDEGAEYGTITASGKFTANTVSALSTVTVRATSNEDTTKYATHRITIQPQPELTQDMLDDLTTYTQLEFLGTLQIDLYTIGQFPRLESTSYIDVTATMDGSSWVGEYENALGGQQYVVYKNVNGIASEVGINYMNEEEYYAVSDDEGNEVTWQASGYYNNFIDQNLTVADFKFDVESWRYIYVGSDKTFAQRVVSSANPYRFEAVNLGLIIEGGELVGISSVSADDYSVANGYRAVMALESYINTENIEMPEISGFVYDEEIHGPLAEAIENMKALNSYKTTFRIIDGNNGLTSGGYQEFVTNDTLYFRDISWEYGMVNGAVGYIDTPVSSPYGYKQTSENVYNHFELSADGFYGYRSYSGTVDSVKPSFAFAAAIFNQYYPEPGTGEMTYWVNSQMTGVASEFYNGIGNSGVQLYGLFAIDPAEYFLTQSYLPYVTVKDGYITEASFYYYLGSVQGIVIIEYSDFNTAELPEEVEFEEKAVPTSWQDEFVYDNEDANLENSIIDEFEKLLGEGAAAEIPYFGNVLGDTFGFGMWNVYMPKGSNIMREAIMLYYDVPLDRDWTITTSIDALSKYLKDNGFEALGNYEYRKGDIGIAIVDADLDFTVYLFSFTVTSVTD